MAPVTIKPLGLDRSICSYGLATFQFPDDDIPSEVPSVDARVNAITAPRLVAPALFKRLAQVPIRLVSGDKIPASASRYPGLDYWRVACARAEQFAEAVNRRGGDVSILRLPDSGLPGNTHFPFSDLNYVAVADLLSAYLAEHALDA